MDGRERWMKKDMDGERKRWMEEKKNVKKKEEWMDEGIIEGKKGRDGSRKNGWEKENEVDN